MVGVFLAWLICELRLLNVKKILQCFRLPTEPEHDN